MIVSLVGLLVAGWCDAGCLVVVVGCVVRHGVGPESTEHPLALLTAKLCNPGLVCLKGVLSTSSLCQPALLLWELLLSELLLYVCVG